MSVIPGAEAWPHFVRNKSEQFEARFVMVEVMKNPSLFLDGMAGICVYRQLLTVFMLNKCCGAQGAAQ